MAGEFYVSGLTGTGFDAGAMVEQIMQLRTIPLQRLQQEKAILQLKADAMGNIAQAISDFNSLFENLNLDDLFKGKKASVSDSSVISVSVTEDAPNIEFTVNVNKLAQAEIRVSNGGLANQDDLLTSSGTLTITYNTGSTTETFNIDYTAGQTLEDLVNAINSAQNRVRASIYYDGTSYRLMLSENDVGASTVETDTAGGIYAIEVTGLPSDLGTGLDTLQNAQNAELTLGSGSPVTSPSNTFENVISGVTIEAKDVGSSSVSITESYSKVEKFLEDFVKKYNALAETIDRFTFGEEAPFRGDYTIGSVKTGIAQRLDPLIELGLIDYDGDTGTISLNSGKLQEILQNDPQKLKETLSQIRDSYGTFLEAQKDLFEGFQRDYEDRMEIIDSRAESLAQRLAQEELILRREFARLEAFIAQAEEIRQRLKSFIVSLSEMTKGGNK